MQCKVAEESATCFRTYEIRLRCPAAHQPILLAGLKRYGANRVIDDGLINVATVSGFGDELSFIVTDGSGQRGDNAFRTWRSNMKKVTCPDTRKLPEIAQVEWVRHFTRFAQRRLGWGDAQTTTKEVAKAVHEENTEELLAIMPEARPLVLCGELQHLPALHDALRSGEPAAVTDCRHQFLTENMSTPPVLGPCGACGKEQRSTYKQGFTGCSKCGLVQCKPCAINTTAEQDHHQSFLRAYHEVRNTHTWAASQQGCDLCGKGPCDCGSKHCDACRAAVQTKQCECGVVRCDRCLHVHAWSDPPVRVDATAAASAQPEAGTLLTSPSASSPQQAAVPVLPPASSQQQTTAPSSQPQAAGPTAPPTVNCTLCGQAPRKVCSCGEGRCEQCFLLTGGSLVETWSYAHPNHLPATCYITDLQKMAKSVQLELLTFELGKDADLVSFARKFQEIFGERINEGSQKSNCLKLYRQYANIAKKDERGSYRTVAEAQTMSYSMECQVPPEELEKFQKLWGEGAPRRCHENNCEMPAGAPLGQHLCAKHADAGKRVLCNRVVDRREDEGGEEVVIYCSGKVLYRSGCRVCSVCGQGAETAEIMEKSLKQEGVTSLHTSLKRGAESLQIANNIWRFSSRSDPDHVPEWTKRRRL